MAQDQVVANDVYERFGLKWAEFPTLATSSSHSDEAELFCARQSLAVYAAYPSDPHDPLHDYIPSQQSGAIATRSLVLARLIGDSSLSMDAETGYRVVTSNKASALMTWKNRHIVIAFRGTANWQDWIHNFSSQTLRTDVIPVSGRYDQYESYELHKGFRGLAENIAPAIFEMMLEFSKAKNLSYQDPATITLCGHSLGGALALNFSSLLWSRSLGYDSFHPELHQFRHGAIYTFGAPRIGKGRIWEFIRRPHYRLVVSGDPVPLSPPGFAADYEAAYLDKPANQAVQPTGSIQRLLKAKWIGSTLNIDISAHNIENYIEAIKKKIDAKMVTR